MAVLSTKYSIGDVVFHASTLTERKRHPCPDCNGSRKWTATSPAGSEYEFGCPRCSSGYISDRDLTLEYSAFCPSIKKLTIGSIQYNTAPGSWDHGGRYMCVETGIGSGSVYNEDELFLTEAEALIAAEAKAASQNTTTEWVVQQYNKMLKVCDYQLENAKLNKAKEAELHASSLLWNLSSLFGDIADADDKEAILELVESYKTYDWERDKGKVDDEAALDRARPARAVEQAKGGET